MASKYPFMPFYVADFQADTMHLNWKAKAAYRALLDSYWIRGRGLNDDDGELAQIIGMTAQEWLQVRDKVMPFFTLSDGLLTQKRMEKEIAEAKLRTETAQAKAAKRWGSSNANAMPQHSPSNANAMQSTSTSTVTSIEEYQERDSTPEKPAASPAPSRPVKHRFGEYHHVLLTDQEYSKLRKDFGENKAAALITFLDEYIQMKGYKAQDHNLVLRKWVRSAVDERSGNKLPASEARNLHFDPEKPALVEAGF